MRYEIAGKILFSRSPKVQSPKVKGGRMEGESPRGLLRIRKIHVSNNNDHNDEL